MRASRAVKALAFVMTALPLLGARAAEVPPKPDATPRPAGEPPSPRAVDDVLFVAPFTLEKGYRNDWSKERALVSSGVLVVLAADPALAARRDAAEPVLYAGDTAVQRLNDGGRSGRVIGIVPGAADLEGVPIWFGAPGLPERVTAATIRAERGHADKRGIRGFPAEKLRSVTRPTVAAADLAALLRDHVVPLVLEYSPDEKDLADAWRLPVAKAPPKEPR